VDEAAAIHGPVSLPFANPLSCGNASACAPTAVLSLASGGQGFVFSFNEPNQLDGQTFRILAGDVTANALDSLGDVAFTAPLDLESPNLTIAADAGSKRVVAVARTVQSDHVESLELSGIGTSSTVIDTVSGATAGAWATSAVAASASNTVVVYERFGVTAPPGRIAVVTAEGRVAQSLTLDDQAGQVGVVIESFQIAPLGDDFVIAWSRNPDVASVFTRRLICSQ
jgi:hypothetical protein